MSANQNADVAELADALVLGTSAYGVEVRVLSSAPNSKNHTNIDKINTLYGFLF